MEYKAYKTVEDSRSEWMKVLQYEDINGQGRLYGGRLMEWMDQVSGIAAVRHCQDNVTTAAVDNLQFKHAAVLNDMIVIISKVTFVGRTSMEVRCDVYIEDRETGKRKPINRAYFTEVHVNNEGKPVPIEYGLKLESESDKAEWEGALKRLDVRKKRRAEGF